MEKQLLTGLVTEQEKQQFTQNGFLLKKGLLSIEEVDEIKDYFMTLHAKGSFPGFKPVSLEEAEGDLLRVYPRMINPHRADPNIIPFMIHPKIMGVLADLLDEEPLASQSMFYFKPPGAKGQALHQDNYYLKVSPGTCMAAWVSIDDADQENGGMVMVPESSQLDTLCPHEADPETSFTNDEVDVPEGMSIVPVDMAAGDILFFNGSVIHGSYPNTSKDRFRRSFICHYAGYSAVKVMEDTLYTHRGELVYREVDESAGPCGVEFDYVTSKAYY
ncbi:phytanoyl-CoA dioxygenase family protein [Paenibacillus montanisoli]|uniref:Phytanoyl-CoA dioxygenase family protein n=1 Tax=Paenibacillus montanisoli TaxID=2081970 RepID=A0A328U4K9_9BACL|nr:phytanoyl-CoA dioxygenase family protein [Paenibacillus montanisoli]RAP75845.1 phytanoyl-CoA dioxygenase family protein [Paenibacillus montanisoli]